MAAEPFCEFGGLPVSSCGHCREQRADPPWVAAGPGPQPLTAEQIRSYVAARWRVLYGIAYPPEQPWAELAEIAGDGDLGPWFLASWDGRCKGCGGMIYAGDSVRWSELEGGTMCLDCAADDG